MRIRFAALAALGAMLVVPAASMASTFSMFFNGSFVDTGWEGTNMLNDVVGMGHSVSTFSGTTAGDFAAATTGVDGLIFPEMENGDLASSLDAAAIQTLRDYVFNGGCLIQANAWPSNASLPNTLFGWSLSQGFVGGTSLDAGQAAGTAFAAGPGSLSGADAVEGYVLASLPVGAKAIYHDGFMASVIMADYGAGHYIYLGFDWFENPTPADWLAVTEIALNECAVVPEPASFAALGLGLLALRRRRKA